MFAISDDVSNRSELNLARDRPEAECGWHEQGVNPGPAGNHAPSIGVHVVVERKAELWTAMFFPGQPANARDPRFKDELLVKLGGSEATRTGTFEIRLNL